MPYKSNKRASYLNDQEIKSYFIASGFVNNMICNEKKNLKSSYVLVFIN